MNLIGIFAGNPTAGGTDGWEVSQNGALTSPVSATVTRGGTEAVKLAVRCEAGYYASTVNLSVATRGSGGSYSSGCDWLRLSVDGTTWTQTLTLHDVYDENSIFYAQITGGVDAGTVSNGAIKLTGNVEAE